MSNYAAVGIIPDDWELSPEAAVDFWGSPTLALLLEMPAAERIRLQLGDIKHNTNDYVYTWGIPDFEAAREMCNVSTEFFCEMFDLTEGQLAILDLGVRSPGFSRLVSMADILGWPLAVFFRNSVELHRVTRLSRKINGALDE